MIWYIVLIAFIMLIANTIQTHFEEFEPWQCQRCMRHKNTKRKCELCEAPMGWMPKNDESSAIVIKPEKKT